MSGFESGIAIGNAFMQGRDRREGGRIYEQLSKSNAPELEPEFKRLLEIAPQKAKSLMDAAGVADASRMNAMLKDAKTAQYLLSNGDNEGAMQLLSNRAQEISRLGGSARETMEVYNAIRDGDPKRAIEMLKGFQDLFTPNTKNSNTATQKDWSTFQTLTQKAMESKDPEDIKKAEQYGRAARFIRETEQEKADIKVSEEERKQMAKANVTRKQGFIDAGVDAAGGVANINRALDLLNEVETGGIDNVAMKAKRFFGIESREEGELSNLMGKSVLAQLKPIFGAAFTVSEGNKLDEIEANFGKNPKTNKKLLENALKIADRAARRGIAAAEDQGDMFTADEIRSAMAFRLDDKVNPQQEAVNAPPPQQGGFKILSVN